MVQTTSYKGYPQFHTLINNTSINFAKVGQGPALVLVHGLTDNWYSWGRMFPYLENHYTLYIPDLPGYGLSDELDSYSIEIMADYIVEFVETLPVDIKAMVGISMGSAIVAEAAKKVSDQIESIILTGPVINKGNTNNITHGLNIFMRAMGSNRVTTRILKRGISTHFAAHNLAKYLNLYDYDPAIIDEFNIGGKRQMSAKAYPKMGVAISKYSLLNTLRQSRIRTLMVYGKQDRVSKAKTAREHLLPYAPHIVVKEVDRAGHWVIADKPAQVADHIINYLSTK